MTPEIYFRDVNHNGRDDATAVVVLPRIFTKAPQRGGALGKLNPLR